MKKIFLSALFLSYSTVGLSFVFHKTDVVGDNKVQLIGGNFNSQTGAFKNPLRCIQVAANGSSIEKIRNNEAFTSTNYRISHEEALYEMGLEGGLDGTLATGEGAKIKAGFENFAKEAETSLVFSFKAVVNGGYSVLKGPYKLTKDAKKMAKASPEAFREFCGDHFVDRVYGQAKAVVFVKVDFLSENIKSQVQNELMLGFTDLLELNSTLKKVEEKFGIKGKVSVVAYQMGGSAPKINGIFGRGQGFSSCNSPNLADCQGTIQDVLNYFSGDFSRQFKGFYHSILHNELVKLPSRYVPNKFSAQSYCNLFPEDRPDHLKCDAKAKREFNAKQIYPTVDEKIKAVTKKFETVMEIKSGANLVIHSVYDENFHEFHKKVKEQKQLLQNLKTQCELEPFSCSRMWINLSKNLTPLDDSFLAEMKKNELKVCFLSGKAELSEFKFLFLDEDGEETETFTMANPPLPGSDSHPARDCYTLIHPGLHTKISGIMVGPKRKVQKRRDQCRGRVTKKYSHWVDWKLHGVEVFHHNLDYKLEFSGRHFKTFSGHKCKTAFKKPRYMKSRSLDLTKSGLIGTFEVPDEL